jgi:hypothetical protein
MATRAVDDTLAGANRWWGVSATGAASCWAAIRLGAKKCTKTVASSSRRPARQSASAHGHSGSAVSGPGRSPTNDGFAGRHGSGAMSGTSKSRSNVLTSTVVKARPRQEARHPARRPQVEGHGIGAALASAGWRAGWLRTRLAGSRAGGIFRPPAAPKWWPPSGVIAQHSST